MRTICILLCSLILGGCAVGKTADGRVVVGPALGELIETAEEAVGAAATAAVAFLPPPFDTIAAPIATLVLGGLGVGAAAKARQRAADQAWEEARTQQLADLAIRGRTNAGSG